MARRHQPEGLGHVRRPSADSGRHWWEQGSMSMGVIVTVIIVASAVFIGSLVAARVLALRQVRVTADLVALSAAVDAAMASDEKACTTADRIAQENDSTVAQCEVVRVGGEVAVKVSVERDVGWSLPVLPSTVTEVAYAGNST